MKDVGETPIFRISKERAKSILPNNTTFDKLSCISYCFGLFDGDDLIGTIVYSIPKTNDVYKKICGDEEKHNILKLSILWIKDDTSNNIESYFISHTIKMVKEEIIITYSEPRNNHVGTVYQASNFHYIGIYNDPIIIKNIKIPIPIKFRYIYFNCSSGKKKHLLKKLKYDILPYPKKLY